MLSSTLAMVVAAVVDFVYRMGLLEWLLFCRPLGSLGSSLLMLVLAIGSLFLVH